MSYPQNSIERMVELHVDASGECWLWTGCLSSSGYGRTAIHGKPLAAPRVFYAHFRGYIPEKHVVVQTCRNRRCVNPAHLEAIPPGVRTLRGNGIGARNARKTVCLRGHALEGTNLQILPDGRRQCVACRAVRRHLNIHYTKENNGGR